MIGRARKYLDGLIARAVRLALGSERSIAQIAADLGIASETLRRCVRQAEAGQGLRSGLRTTSAWEEMRRLRRENFELRRAIEILQSVRVFSPRSSTSTGRSERVHRCVSCRFGVEPICSVLGVSASVYYQRKTAARSQRVVEDERLLVLIRELHLANYEAAVNTCRMTTRRCSPITACWRPAAASGTPTTTRSPRASSTPSRPS